MTAQQYLLEQAELCRSRAREHVDRFVARALLRLADEFERKACSVTPIEQQSAQAA